MFITYLFAMQNGKKTTAIENTTEKRKKPSFSTETSELVEIVAHRIADEKTEARRREEKKTNNNLTLTWAN